MPDATVKVEVGEFKADLTTDNRGYFNIEVAAEHITPTTLAIITVSKAGYVAQAKATVVKLVETGATSVTSIEVVLKAESSDIPDEDPSKGGEQTIEVPVDKAEPTKVEDIKEPEVKADIEKVAEELGIEDITKIDIPVVKVEEALVVELVSQGLLMKQQVKQLKRLKLLPTRSHCLLTHKFIM